MWYVFFAIITLWVLYQYNKRGEKTPDISFPMQVDNDAWKEAQEEAKMEKAQTLKKFKKLFEKPASVEEAINAMEAAVNDFIVNHGQSVSDIEADFENIELLEDIKKYELALRKEINKHYKNRDNVKSKVLSIYIAFQHAKLLLHNPEMEWKNFVGLQKLQSNLKAEEYFDALLKLMHAFQKEFSNSPLSEKLPNDIERTFELWNSRNIAKEIYEQNCAALKKASGASEEHFVILNIVEYLDRCYRFNPRYRDKLVEWCEKDVGLYEKFLIESHESLVFTADEQVEFFYNPLLKQEKLSLIAFKKVKRLKNYFVPRLNSYDVLEGIYKHEQNSEKLDWLRNIGMHISYIGRDNAEQLNPERPGVVLNLSQITRTIEAFKSGQKGKLAFLNSSGDACSTEDTFKDYMERLGWNVMRAEVSFWQAMFCLSFWEEIFDGMGNPVRGQDMPIDIFHGAEFYLSRQVSIDRKFEKLLQYDLQAYINSQIQKSKGSWTRLVNESYHSSIEYFETPIVQSFLATVSPEVFAKIVYRIAQNPNENRSGVPDFVIWNGQEFKMTEVKKVREQVRESQKVWIAWMLSESIPIDIVRVKGVNSMVDS